VGSSDGQVYNAGSIHEENEMTDKKSVVVTLANGAERRYIEKDGVEYDYQIGEHNGCLAIIAKTTVESVISVPDTEEVIYSYAATQWAVAKII